MRVDPPLCGSALAPASRDSGASAVSVQMPRETPGRAERSRIVSEPEPHLQQPCMLCGLMVDLPAIWTCPCGAWRLCYRSACLLRIPRDHRDGTCAEPTRLRWTPAHADDLPRLSARRRIIWVAVAWDGHAAALPSSVHINDALANYRAGPGANAGGVMLRWQMWEQGRMYALG